MANQTMQLRVTIDSTWKAGTTLQVYSDLGSGTVDFNTPLLAKPQPVFISQPIARQPFDGFGGRMTRVLPSYPQRMSFDRGSIFDRSLSNAPGYVDVVFDVPAAYGLHKFVVKAIDLEGNIQTAAAAERSQFVSSTEADSVATFDFNSFDAGTRRATFSIT